MKLILSKSFYNGLIQDKVDISQLNLLGRVFFAFLLILGCYITSSDLFIYMYLLFCVVNLLVLPINKGLCFLFAVTNFYKLVCLSSNYQASYHFLLIAVFLIRHIITLKIHKRVYFSYFVLICFFVIGGVGSITDIKTIMNYTLLMVAAFVFINYKDSWKQYFDFYVIGHMLATMVSLICRNSARLQETLFADYTLIGGMTLRRFGGANYDCNYYGANCLFILAVLLYCLSNTRRMALNNKRLVFLALLYSVCGFMSLSKTYIVGMLVLWLVFFSLNTTHNFGKVLFALSVMITVLYIGNSVTNNMFFEMAFGRFSTALDASTLTSGRLEIWVDYIEAWKSSTKTILFGWGMPYKQLATSSFAPHNTYIEILYQFGIVGSSLIVVYYIAVTNWIRKNVYVKKMTAKLLPLFALLFFAMGIGLFTQDLFVIAIFFTFIFIAGCAHDDYES